MSRAYYIGQVLAKQAVEKAPKQPGKYVPKEIGEETFLDDSAVPGIMATAGADPIRKRLSAAFARGVDIADPDLPDIISAGPKRGVRGSKLSKKTLRNLKRHHKHVAKLKELLGVPEVSIRMPSAYGQSIGPHYIEGLGRDFEYPKGKIGDLLRKHHEKSVRGKLSKFQRARGAVVGKTDMPLHILGHEFGHSQRSRLAGILRRLSLLQPISMIAAPALAARWAGDEDLSLGQSVLRGGLIGGGTGLIGAAPVLGEEARASYNAMKALRKMKHLGPEKLKYMRNQLARAFGSYAVTPVAGILLGIGAALLSRRAARRERRQVASEIEGKAGNEGDVT